GRTRISVSAAAAVSGNSLFLQGFRLCHQIFHAPADAVGSQHAHNRRYSAQKQPGQLNRRRLGMKASLSAASGNMDMAVDNSRRQDLSFPIDNLCALIIRKM